MKLTASTAIAAVLLLGACAATTEASAPDQPVETADASAGADAASAPEQAADFDLEYEKFTLENGLEVILHVDRSDPIVAFSTVVHVGSNREKPGRTGFAHFFEHMAFNDSENVPRGWNRKAIPDWGGERNGGTWSDGTIYYEVVPKDAFDKILWIDSDRLGYMINTVTEAALEREKQVVKNEKRERVDNQPYGYTQEVIRTALYPEGHPYSWTVIGQLPDLQAATLDDLKEFYEQYYGAGNATLSIVGDIDIEETKEKVQRWFGEIRKGPDVEALAPMPVKLEETKSLWFEDNFAKLPELRMTFPTVEAYHEDEQALDVLARLIAGTKTSPLYRGIVETEALAPDVSAYNNSMELAGEFVFRVRAKEGVDLDTVQAAIEDAFATFEEEGVNETDLQRIKAEQETILYNNLSTVLGKANQMSSDNEFAGDPSYAITEAELLRAVTAEDVMRVYETYIKDKPAVVTSFVPQGEADLALEGAEKAEVWIEEVKADVAAEEVSQGEEADYEKTPSQYDRSEPPFGDLPLIEMPEVWTAELANGASLFGIENNELPLVTFDIVFDAGSWMDPDGKVGTASLVADMLNEGTATKTAAELEQAIGLLGAGISVSADSDSVTISATTLARNFEEVAALIVEMLTEPRWDEDYFAREKSAALTTIKDREASPPYIAANAFAKLLYGADHPKGRFSIGTEESVSAIELDDLKAYFDEMLATNVRMHIAGAVSQERAEAVFGEIAGLLDEEKVALPESAIPEQDDEGKVYFIDVPGSKQSVLAIGKLTVATPHPDYNKIVFANEKLGGGISGDLAQVLRIEKGYTYGAYSYVTGGLVPQPFRIGTSVRANATEPSLEVIRDMLVQYGPDFDEAAVELTRQKLVKEDTRAFESLSEKLGTLREISKYGKSLTFVEDEQQELLSMPLEEYKRVIAEYLAEPDMTWIIIGDGETQLEPVKSFAGGDVTLLDIFGDPVEAGTPSEE
ncbi:M16 family metallopeptidase [Henriciella mobilis]|uniref:Insulinase family protein n=1 Tax=Henriciella mobilis TaxID=2305467 RepID=A0A399R7W5_9PROT|nr:pitrilysin family protein [Henriciella mobilis]RIJ18386.1 insulinase family protein [Henriciella mobilis]RIJ24811.1 insulinase family protein [Henriciella mobilis]RIJ26863.1 insulinase family protein [Henriciella mobilis]